MKVIVAIKRVVDYKATVRVKQDGSAIDTTNVKMSMNPFDEIAVEEALKMRESQIANEVIAVSIGKEVCQETLRTALAMGCDRAILIKSEEEVAPLQVAKVLKAMVLQEGADFVLLGKQAIDNDDNQVGQMLAGLLQWGQGTFASKLEFNEGHVRVTREIDGGLETLSLKLPAVVTTDLRLNVPRFISLPNIMQAKNKPLLVIPIDTLAVDLNSAIKTLSYTMPSKTRQCQRLQNVAELVEKLKNEAQVLA